MLTPIYYIPLIDVHNTYSFIKYVGLPKVKKISSKIKCQTTQNR